MKREPLSRIKAELQKRADLHLERMDDPHHGRSNKLDKHWHEVQSATYLQCLRMLDGEEPLEFV